MVFLAIIISVIITKVFKNLTLKAINTRLLINFVHHQKKQEIEHCLSKIDMLNRLMAENPEQKVYESRFKIIKSRLEMLIYAKAELERLENYMNNLV